MLNQFPFLIKVKFYDEDFTKTLNENIILCTDSYKECVGLIEDYYGSTLISFEIMLLKDGLLVISDDIVNMLEKECDY